MTNYKVKIMIENIIFVALIVLWLLPICICTFDFAAYILLDRFIVIDWSIFRTFAVLIWTIVVLIIANSVKE